MSAMTLIGKMTSFQTEPNASCTHHWRWYFANSTGILMNKANWDGPLGYYPWQDWQDQALHGTSDSRADAYPNRP